MHFQVMAKPAGPSCNLCCSYCFYTEKESLYGGSGAYRMREEVLESFVRQYIACQSSPKVSFAWQGGEPTLLGLDYFRLIVSLQKKHANGKVIDNTIQTNGTLLDDAWCRFFRENNFLVGVSIDGPRKLHDRFRTRAAGTPTFDAVVSALTLLKGHGVSFNTLTVINSMNAEQPLAVYRFLKRAGDGHMQFIPAVERVPGREAELLGLALAMPPTADKPATGLQVTDWSVSAEQLAKFYITVFDEWLCNDVGTVFVQFFDVALGNWLGAGSGLCQFAPRCGMAGALEHNGDLYACDHYVYPEHKLGNIMETPLTELMGSARQLDFGRVKQESLPVCCRECEVLPACNGDCPKHRFVPTAAGEPEVSYLCSGYRQIFGHMAPYLGKMASLIRQGRPVPEIMQLMRQQNPSSVAVPGRNSPCSCGSGRKYKRCCGRE